MTYTLKMNLAVIISLANPQFPKSHLMELRLVAHINIKSKSGKRKCLLKFAVTLTGWK